MTNINKASVVIDGQTMHLSMSFEKVDKQKRTVSGWATIDSEDTQGDIVTAEASAKAFAKARGNLREMHRKDEAVGRIVNFREEELMIDGNLHKGIFVTARVSEGAPNTWLKVLDGTLSGFSIAGKVNEMTNEISKKSGNKIQKVLDYDLTELSLVDNPAHPHADITNIEKVFSIEKSAGSVTVTGMVAETVLETVFICPADDTVVVAVRDEVDCPTCGTKMEDAGWFESTGDDRAEKVKKIVDGFKGVTTATTGGDNDMAKKTEDEPTVEDVATPEVEDEKEIPAEDVSETPAEEETPDAPVDVEEITDDTEEITKQIDDLKGSIKDLFEKNTADAAAQIAALEEKIDEVNATFEKKFSEVENKFSEFGEKLELTKVQLNNLDESLEKVNASDALRKSADFEEAPAVETKRTETLWGRTFSGNDLFRN